MNKADNFLNQQRQAGMLMLRGQSILNILKHSPHYDPKTHKNITVITCSEFKTTRYLNEEGVTHVEESYRTGTYSQHINSEVDLFVLINFPDDIKYDVTKIYNRYGKEVITLNIEI